MPPHPQNSPRGLWAKDRIQIKASGGLLYSDYSASALLVKANSTGLVLAGGLRVSDKANATLTGNSTGLIVVGSVSVSNLATHKITANSTGLRIGSRYISTNVTSNAVT